MSNYDECEKDILEQIEDALRKDPNRIGDVFRSWEENEDDYDAIASDLGWESTSTVYAYMNYIDGIFQDFETDSPGKAIQVSRQINSFLKRNSSKFDKPTLKYVESAISFYDEISKEEKNVLHEGENSITKLKEIVNKERIYVYSYPSLCQLPSYS